MNSKMTRNSQLSTTESKKKEKKKLIKPPEKEKNKYEDYLEGYQLGEGRGKMGELVQGL